MEEKKNAVEENQVPVTQDQNGDDEFYTAEPGTEESQSESNSLDEEAETYHSLLKANEKRLMRLFKTHSGKKYPR